MGELEQKFIRMVELQEKISALNDEDKTFDEYCEEKGCVYKDNSELLKRVEYDSNLLSGYTDDFDYSKFQDTIPTKEVMKEVHIDRVDYPMFFVYTSGFTICGLIVWLLMWLSGDTSESTLLCIKGGVGILVINVIILLIVSMINKSKLSFEEDIERKRVDTYNNGTYVKLLDNYNYTQEKIKEAKRNINVRLAQDKDRYNVERNNLKVEYDKWHESYLEEYNTHQDEINECSVLIDELHAGNIDEDTAYEIKDMLVTYRVNTLKEAYDVLEQREHDRRMEYIAKRQREESERAERIARDEAREAARYAEQRAREAENRARDEARRAANEAKADHERRAREYASAESQARHNEKIYGQNSMMAEFARQRRDKAFADLYK